MDYRKQTVLVLSVLDVLFITIGLTVLIFELVLRHGTFLDFIFSTLFMISNVFFGIQSIAYIMNYIRSLEYYPATLDNFLVKRTEKMTAILVPLYNEDLKMVRENISAIINTADNLANVYILDDSTDGSSDEISKLCKSCGINYLHRINRRGYKAGALNDAIRTMSEKYIAVIDIDQTPDQNFLKEIIPIISMDDSIAYVQVPQYYTNTDSGVIASMASGQQFIFYEILTEGKSVINTLFSCGTNIIYRKSALESVGYFDETNITEDIATSIRILEKGYRSLYFNRKLVYGRAPTTLEGYINQQYRWAFGSLGLFKLIFKGIVMNKKFSRTVRFDWFVTSTWFTFGWFYLMFLIAPILDVIGIKVMSLTPILYFVAWLPYSILILSLFFITHVQKGAPIKTVFYNMSINVIMFTMSISVTINLLRNKKKPFITARTGGKVPWYKFTFQLILMVLLAFSAVFLVLKGTMYGYITAFWAIFDLILLLPIFFMNRIPRVSLMDATLLTKKN